MTSERTAGRATCPSTRPGEEVDQHPRAGSDRNTSCRPCLAEAAVEYIEEDELVEAAQPIRLRKVLLQEVQRRRAARQRA